VTAFAATNSICNLQSSICNSHYFVTFAVCEPCFLKHTRRRKFAELVTNHVFGHKNRLKNLSVVNQKRVADKSGVTIERRDQVLIGFFAPRYSSYRSSPADAIRRRVLLQ